MNLVQFSLIVLTIATLSAGQILFKLVADSLPSPDQWALRSLVTGRLLAALAIYAVATALWIAALRNTPLRIAYPFSALAFIFVPLMAHFWIGEALRWNTFAGAAVIILGVWISVGWE